jgi:hypothetical protein
MDTIRKSPVLRSTAKTGKAKFWQLQLLNRSVIQVHEYYLQSHWWQDGAVHQSSTPERIFGKNAGRSNATSDLQQQANWSSTPWYGSAETRASQRTGAHSHVYTKPMLAHVFAERVGQIKWPVYVQPKLDGFRMLMDGEAMRGRAVARIMWSASST